MQIKHATKREHCVHNSTSFTFISLSSHNSFHIVHVHRHVDGIWCLSDAFPPHTNPSATMEYACTSSAGSIFQSISLSQQIVRKSYSPTEAIDSHATTTSISMRLPSKSNHIDHSFLLRLTVSFFVDFQCSSNAIPRKLRLFFSLLNVNTHRRPNGWQ